MRLVDILTENEERHAVIKKSVRVFPQPLEQAQEIADNYDITVAHLLSEAVSIGISQLYDDFIAIEKQQGRK